MKEYKITEEEIEDIISFMNKRSLLSAKEVLKNLKEYKKPKKENKKKDIPADINEARLLIPEKEGPSYYWYKEDAIKEKLKITKIKIKARLDSCGFERIVNELNPDIEKIFLEEFGSNLIEIKEEKNVPVE